MNTSVTLIIPTWLVLLLSVALILQIVNYVLSRYLAYLNFKLEKIRNETAHERSRDLDDVEKINVPDLS